MPEGREPCHPLRDVVQVRYRACYRGQCTLGLLHRRQLAAHGGYIRSQALGLLGDLRVQIEVRHWSAGCSETLSIRAIRGYFLHGPGQLRRVEERFILGVECSPEHVTRCVDRSEEWVPACRETGYQAGGLTHGLYDHPTRLRVHILDGTRYGSIFLR